MVQPIAGGEIQVWRIDLDAEAGLERDLARTLSADEVGRAARFRNEADGRRFVSARSALRNILARYTGLEAAAIAFHHGPNGKPLLAGRNGGDAIHFNLAHSRSVALCAVALGREIGVDVEWIDRELPVNQLAAQFFSDREQTLIASAVDPFDAFTRIWVRKEARLKATGEGIGGELALINAAGGAPRVGEDPPQNSLIWSFREIPVPDGYVAALAAEGEFADSIMDYSPTN